MCRFCYVYVYVPLRRKSLPAVWDDDIVSRAIGPWDDTKRDV